MKKTQGEPEAKKDSSLLDYRGKSSNIASIDPDLDQGIKKLANTQVLIQLEGLHQIYQALMIPTKGRKVLADRDRELAREHLMNSLTYNYAKGSDLLLTSTAMQYLHRLVSKRHLDLSDTINRIVRILEEYTKDKSDVNADYIDTILVGLHKLITRIEAVFVGKEHSSIQPLRSYLPPEWDKKHPYVRLLKSPELWKPISRCIKTSFVSQENLVASFLLFEPLVKMYANTAHATDQLLEILELMFHGPSRESPTSAYFQMAIISLFEIINAIPLARTNIRLTLIKFIMAWRASCRDAVIRSPFHEKLPDFLIIHLLNLALYKRTGHCKAHHLSTLDVLDEIRVVLKAKQNSDAYKLIFSCLVYLLDTSKSQFEAEALLDLIETVGAGPIPSAARCLAVYPLITTISRGKCGHMRSRCSTLIQSWFGDIKDDPSTCLGLEASEMLCSLSSDCAHYAVPFIPEAGLADFLFILGDSKSLLSESRDFLALRRFCVPSNFYGSDSIKALDWFISASHLSTEGLDILSLLVFLLQTNTPAILKRHIIFHALPHLAQASGTHLSARVLRLIQSLDGTEPRLDAVTIRALCALYLVYPRAWAPLRHKLANWIRHYKEKVPHGKSSRGLTPGPIEVAAITTLRETCASMPQACQDLFPLLVSLLQYASLPPPAVAMILSCINSAVKHGVVGSAAVWSLLIESFSNQVSLADGDVDVLKELFCFYQQLVSHSATSEALMPVLDDILQRQVLPAVFPPDKLPLNPNVLAEALKTLLVYPGSIVSGSISLSPTELVADLLSMRTGNLAWSPLLGLLMDQELDQMSRTIFKGSISLVSRASAASQDNLADIRAQVRNNVQEILTGQCPPGVQANLALARLFADIANVGADRKTISRRVLQTSLTNLSPGLDLGLQSLHFSAWVSFFTTAAAEPAALDPPSPESHTLVDHEMLGDLFKELTSTLSSSQIPTVLANACIALCALPQALASLGKDSLARTYGVQAVGLLKDMPTKSSAVLTAMASGLSGLASVISHEIGCLKDIIRFLKDTLEAPQKPGVEWVHLACLRGLARVYDVALGGLMSGISGEATSLLASIGEALECQQLATLVEADSLDEESAMPTLLGKTLAHAQISASWFCHSKLHSHLALPDLPPGILLPGPLLDILTRKLDSLLNEQEDRPGLMNHTLATVLALPALSPLIPHLAADRQSEAELDACIFKVLNKALQSQLSLAMAHLIHSALGAHLHIRANQHPPIATIGSYNKHLNSYLEALETKTTNNLPLLSGLSALLGADPYDYMACPPYFLDQASNSKINKRAFNRLRASQVSSSDLASSRVALVTLGRIAQLGLSPFPCNQSNLFRLVSTHASHLQSQSFGSISNEPADYSRFPASSSYLRAVFTGIQHASKVADLVPTCLVLLQALTDLSHPLPPANWLVILRQLYAHLSTPEEILLLIRFCLARFRFSASLVEFTLFLLSYHTRTLPLLSPSAFELLVGEAGVGVLASLVGLHSKSAPESQQMAGSWATVLKPVALALPRYQETLVNLLAYFGTNLDALPFFAIFLSAINDHLNCPPVDDPSFGEINQLIDELQDVARTLLANTSLLEVIASRGFKDQVLIGLSRLANVNPAQLPQLHLDLPLPAYFSCIQASYEKHRDLPSIQALIEGFLVGLQSQLASPCPRAADGLVEVIVKFSAMPQDQLAWVVRIFDSLIIAQDEIQVPLDLLVVTGLETVALVMSPCTDPSPSPFEIPIHLSRAAWKVVQLLEKHESTKVSVGLLSDPKGNPSPFRAQLIGRLIKFSKDLQKNHAKSLAYRCVQLWLLYFTA
ncbi:hypothetical protein DSO57_1016967 [Entomophthora muscae]|uniref:Uncharacterized protein n=1 Tax=Entomophthora muscae TaxID=34485 RepID=A0ACC2UQS6_9FUNG|nr:hypothetical protein DSO57_1016967 [Entomophthora muscae]